MLQNSIFRWNFSLVVVGRVHLCGKGRVVGVDGSVVAVAEQRDDEAVRVGVVHLGGNSIGKNLA